MLGSKYTFGGQNEADGYDCSSLVQKVYKEAVGIELGRTTKEQIEQGMPIDMMELQPGDLIFYGDGSSMDDSSVNHVGIYIGNEQIIHAQGVGFGVTKGYWYSNPNYIKFVSVVSAQ